MKRLTGIFFLFFCLSVVSAQAATTPKAGAKCPKQGITKSYQGKTFTCIKLGKKLVWNKGAINPKSVPTPTPTPTPTITPAPKDNFVPWSTQFSSEVVSLKAFKSFSDWSKEQTLSPKKHQVLAQDSLDSFAVFVDLKKIDEFTSGIFSQFFKKNSVTVFGKSEEWITSQILSSGGNLRNTQGRCNEQYGIFSLCMNRDSHFGLGIGGDCFVSSSRDACGISLVPHEYFHLVQINLSNNVEGSHWNFGDEFAKYSFPHWLVEGSANFVASAITSIYTGREYSDLRSLSLSSRPKGPNMANALVDYEIRTPTQGWEDGLYSYNIGHIATEYIVASVGFQKFMEIWKSYSTTRNFYESFEKATGITTSTFYSKFEAARQSLAIPPVTWKRDGNLQNNAIKP